MTEHRRVSACSERTHTCGGQDTCKNAFGMFISGAFFTVVTQIALLTVAVFDEEKVRSTTPPTRQGMAAAALRAPSSSCCGHPGALCRLRRPPGWWHWRASPWGCAERRGEPFALPQSLFSASLMNIVVSLQMGGMGQENKAYT